MIITRERMRRFAGEGSDAVASYLDAAASRWLIDTPLRIAHWLGQMAYESMFFTRTRESLDYSVEALLSLFSRERISEEQARKFGRTAVQKANQEAIANCIYGPHCKVGRELGNTEPGDGWLFRGHGYKQVTGRANHGACSTALFHDDRLLSVPQILEQPPGAAQSAGWFWKSHNLNDLADQDDVRGITKVINGGSMGLLEREIRTISAKQIFT